MAIYIEINPREREATLRSSHSLCAGESAEIVLSGVPDADTATLSLRLYRDRSEAEFVAAARRPGDADPPQEGFAAVQGRAALRRAVLDLRSESVASWASDVFERSESESDGPEGAPRPPEAAWMVVADVSRVWAACEVPFLLRPMSPESADVSPTLPSLVERAAAAAESAERSASAASASALEASRAAERAAAAVDGKADLVDGRVPASQLPSYVDDVLEVAELPASGESGKLYVVTGTNAVYRWSGSGFVEVSPSRDWSGELAAKRDRTDLSVDPGEWLLVKPDGAQVWLVKPDPQQDTWVGDGFTLAYETTEAYWVLTKVDETSGVLVVDDSDDSPPDANRLEFTGTDGTSVYRLVRGSRLALDTEIPLADSAVTRTSANPVKSSGIWSAIWGALTDIPRHFTSLYDYCMGWFIDAESIAPSWDYGTASSTYHVGDLRVESRMEGASGRLYRCKKEYYADSDSNGPSFDAEHWEPVDVTTLIAGKQDALSALQLANIAAVPGKADAADLRYALVVAPVATTYSVPDSWFPITFETNGTSYTVPLADKDKIVYIDGAYNDGDLGYRPEEGVIVSLVYFVDAVLYAISPDVLPSLQFAGAVPVVGETALDATTTATLADRTVNLITAADGTASIDIELPAPYEEPSGEPHRARDLFLDVDNRQNTSDLKLEFTNLGSDWGFVVEDGESIGEMTTIAGEKTESGVTTPGERVRFYFTECAIPPTDSTVNYLLHVARVTLSADITSISREGAV